MALRVEKRDGTGERQVLIGMIVSKAVLGPIAAKWDRTLFPSRAGQLIGGWAVDHFSRYRRAPGTSIFMYFEDWAASGSADPDTVQRIESLLAGLNDEYDYLKRTVSPDHLVDVAAKLFTRGRLEDLKARIEAKLELGKVEEAEQLVEAHRRIGLGLGAGIDVLNAEGAIEAAFADMGSSIVEYPDAIGNFFASSLCRDAFISFMGPEKSGKSFWLQDLAWRAVEQQRNTAYFEVGDNSQSQVLRRFASRACGRPVRRPETGKFARPVKLDPPPDGELLAEVEHEYVRVDGDLSPGEAMRTLADLGDRVGWDRFKLSCHPNSSISVAGIDTILDGWSRDGWHPDAVVIDYADILAPLNGRDETREQINATWKALRALSQRLHCLVVTATQTDSDSYSARTLRRENFSEDKRKFAHVTGMIGINQTQPEKDRGLYRLNWVLLRDLEFSTGTCVWSAACLATAEPCVLSTFG